MLYSYSTIAWSASIRKGVQPDVQYGYKAKSTSGTIFNFFNALGEVAFAYAGHNVVLEIQATIPSTPEKPSKGPMWRGVVVAYIIIALCYFPVALIGYWMFGNAVDDNILISLQKPKWLIATANLFVVVHVIGGYQVRIKFSNFCFFFFWRFLRLIKHSRLLTSFLLFSLTQVYAMPVFDMIETLLVKKLNFKPSMMLRFVVRNIYVGK